MHKMYCIIRKDMPTSYRACQGGHAIAQYFIDHGMHDIWDNGTMIYLKAHDEDHLLEIKKGLETNAIKHSIFIEPDLGDQHTALACIDTGERFRDLVLL
jgi:hypothetical protein